MAATFSALSSSMVMPGGDTLGQWYANTGMPAAAPTTSP